jgi:carboxypeptidase family protein
LYEWLKSGVNVIEMTLDTQHNEKKLVDKELYHRLNKQVTIFIILISCLGSATATLISIPHGSSTFITPFSSFSESTSSPLTRDHGSVSGFVTSSDSMPVDGASIVAYKSIGLVNSADKNAGYFASVATEPDGSFVLSDLPSGVYKITVTHPTGAIQTINNYAVWPSSASSYVFVAK